ncbi:MAG: histidine kinase [Bacteroidales bacterium]|jgi:LytS/YehU family sensor histidine kinase|nr:histidine kinase [Bacteroidales bacterium]
MRHPLIVNRSRFLAWWLAWVALAAGQSSLIHFVYGSSLDAAIADGLISMILFGLIGLAVWFPFRTMLKNNRQILSNILNLVLTGTVAIIFWLFATKYLVRAIVPEKMDYQLFWHSVIFFRITAGVLIFILIILAYYLFLSAAQLAEKASRQAQLESLVREAELKILRSQINPHFLFNSLNSISSLTVTDPLKAREMIVKLSDFMRYSLSSRNDQPVTLRNEMESLRLYLDIEKIRFSDRLEIEEEISDECLPALLPGLLLQPLYENAVKHGVYESTERVTIRTTVRRDGDSVIISVTNNVDPEAIVTRKGAGIGLKNVRGRLELFYGETGEMTVTRMEDSFNVNLRFPYKE